ncbi:MAG: TonB-dependent receptor, partial [Oxalicibacterium faecigallinarum]|uniref:TonB-dependent receptor domain-containing protein n=1 Tax=Oxalicibacterium faecigallinarum TaxID=573741 RepID=UPI00280A3B6F
MRAEYDLSQNTTAWAAFGIRETTEVNSLANITVTNASTGAANTRKADNYREDLVKSGEVGLRSKLRTGSIGHTLVASASIYRLDSKNAFSYSPAGGLLTNMYNPIQRPAPATNSPTGGIMWHPLVTSKKDFVSVAIGDTISFADDRALLTIGVRNQTIEATSYQATTGAMTSGYDKSRTSPVVGMVWKANNSVSLYANYIESLSQGPTAATVGAITPTNLGEIFSPYVSKQKEIGAKYDGGKFGGGLAYFTTKKP